MDLVLLQPGNTDIKGASQINGKLEGGEKETDKDAEIKAYQCIELVSMHYSMKQQITTDVSNSARTSGRPEVTDITAIKYFDSSSTALYSSCLGGTPIGGNGTDDITKIFLCRNNRDQIACIMTLELSDAIVSSIECQSHPNDMPTEKLTINFTAVNWIYNHQSNDMYISGKKVAGWSVAQNRPVPPPG